MPPYPLTWIFIDERGVQKVPPPISKICHIYLTMMKLGTAVPSLKNIQKIKEIPL